MSKIKKLAPRDRADGRAPLSTEFVDKLVEKPLARDARRDGPKQRAQWPKKRQPALGALTFRPPFLR
jgi:hypothetical protein